MKLVAVADTHTALWYLFGDERLSSVARTFISRATEEGNEIAVSSISLVELVYLIEKGRVTLAAYEDLRAVLADPGHVFREAPVSAPIVESLRLVPRTEVPDMPDRIVAATGIYFGVPVISRDRHIRAANLETIW